MEIHKYQGLDAIANRSILAQTFAVGAMTSPEPFVRAICVAAATTNAVAAGLSVLSGTWRLRHARTLEETKKPN